MNPDAFIEALARDFGPVPRARLRLVPIAASAVLAAAAVALFWGVRPGALQALATPALWLKCGYTIGLALAALMLASRLGTPGADWRRPALALATLTAAALLSGALILAGASTPERFGDVMGRTWSSCSLSILALSLVIMPALLFASRNFAPVETQFAGAALGIASGAIAAAAYGALYCAESAVPFVAVWYTVGIAAAGLAGSAAGRLWLRW